MPAPAATTRCATSCQVSCSMFSWRPDRGGRAPAASVPWFAGLVTLPKRQACGLAPSTDSPVGVLGCRRVLATTAQVHSWGPAVLALRLPVRLSFHPFYPTLTAAEQSLFQDPVVRAALCRTRMLPVLPVFCAFSLFRADREAALPIAGHGVGAGNQGNQGGGGLGGGGGVGSPQEVTISAFSCLLPFASLDVGPYCKAAVRHITGPAAEVLCVRSCLCSCTPCRFLTPTLTCFLLHPCSTSRRRPTTRATTRRTRCFSSPFRHTHLTSSDAVPDGLLAEAPNEVLCKIATVRLPQF